MNFVLRECTMFPLTKRAGSHLRKLSSSRDLFFLGKISTFARRFGLVAERLGTGLQNRILRFESGRDLLKALFFQGFLH